MKPEEALQEIDDLFRGLLEVSKTYEKTAKELGQESSKNAAYVDGQIKSILEKIDLFHSDVKKNEISLNSIKNSGGAKKHYLWGATLFLCIAVGSSIYMQEKGYSAGYNSGYGKGYEEAKDEKAAASWANTPEGKLAYSFAQSGELQRLTRCQGNDWEIQNGFCYPFPDKKGMAHGWELPKPKKSK